jgi:hypothetical protein
VGQARHCGRRPTGPAITGCPFRWVDARNASLDPPHNPWHQWRNKLKLRGSFFWLSWRIRALSAKMKSRLVWSFGIVLIGLFLTASYFALIREVYRSNRFLSRWTEMNPLIMGPFLILATGLGVSRTSRLRRVLGLIGIVVIVLPAAFVVGLAYREMVDVRISGYPLSISGAEFLGVHVLIFGLFPLSIVILLTSLITSEIGLFGLPRCLHDERF